MNIISKTVFQENLEAILLILLGSSIRLIAAIIFTPRGDGYQWLVVARYFSRVGELPIPDIYYVQTGIALQVHHGPLSFIFGSFFYFIFSIFGQGEFGLILTPYIFSILNLIIGYILIKKLHGKRIAIWSLLVLALIPIDITNIMHSPIKNIASFMIILSLYLYVISEQRRYKPIFLSGVFGGLAFLIAYHSIVLPTIILSMTLFQYLKDKRFTLMGPCIIYFIGFIMASSWMLIRNIASGGTILLFGETLPVFPRFEFLFALFSYDLWYYTFVWFWLGRPVELSVFISKASLLIPQIQFFITLWVIMMSFLSFVYLVGVYSSCKDFEKHKLEILCLLWAMMIVVLSRFLLAFSISIRLRELGPFIAILAIFPGKLLERLYKDIKSNMPLVLIKWKLNNGILKIIFISILFFQMVATSAVFLENYHHKIRAEPFLKEYKWGRENLPKGATILVPGYSYFYAWYLDRPVIYFDEYSNFPSLSDIEDKDAKFISTYLSEWAIHYIWVEERGASSFPQWFLEVIEESAYFVLIHSNENYNRQVYEIRYE